MTEAVVLDFSGMFESKPKGPPPKRKAKPAAEAPPLPTAAGAPPVLTLQQFGSAPKVDFGDAPAGAVTSRTLVVDNDGSLAKRLEVKGIEKRDALRVYPSSFEVAAGARREVTVSWTPAKEGVLSKKLEFSCNGGHVVHAQLVGACKRAGRPAMVKTAAPAAGAERIPLSPNDANRGKSFSQGPAQRALALKADVVVAPPKPVVAAPPKPKPAPKPAAAPAAAAAPPGGRLVLKKPAVPKAPPKPAAAPPAVPAEAASGGRFYDEQWREKREHGFVEWTNYMLCEPALSTAPAQLDAGERQRLSLRQLEQQRQEAVLRRRATLLLRGATLRPVLTKVEQNVEDGLLAIKASANLAADVGMRDNLLNLLGCYNPLWLRLAAEAVSGEMLPAGTAADDAVALRRFVDRRLLQPPPAAIEAPPVGMHPAQAAKHAAAAAQGAAHKAIVRRVLSLVVLLDAAKEGAILTSDPCLFCPDSHFKSSKALAQEFAKQYLSGGVGELVKHLKTLGYELTHSQTALHEYNFRLTSLASDLRDGARLCRLVELIAPPAALEKARARALKANKGVLRPLTGLLRLPAGSRLQKVHNNKLALDALADGGVAPFAGGAKAVKDGAELLVDGHRESTLGTLWALVAELAMPALAPAADLEREIGRARKAARQHGGVIVSEKPATREADAADAAGCELLATGASAALLLHWAKAVCGVYGVRIHNLSTSFRDGLALALVVHHYLPELLPRDALRLDANGDAKDGAAADGLSDELGDGDWVRGEGATAPKEKREAAAEAATARLASFQEAAVSVGCVPMLLGAADCTGCGPDEQVSALLLAHLFARVTQLAAHAQAAGVLQRAWRVRQSGSAPWPRFRRAVAEIKRKTTGRVAVAQAPTRSGE